MEKIEIKKAELKEEIEDIPELPKYSSFLINRANRWSHGTRPKVVGQMSELVRDCPYDTYDEWKEWYLDRKPNAIEEATDRITDMLDNFRGVLDEIDREMVKAWVKELVLVDSFIGINLQEPILKKIASITDESYELATPEDESRGIDGYLGGEPVSIKPSTYAGERDLKEIEGIDVKIITYDEKDDKVIVDISDFSEK